MSKREAIASFFKRRQVKGMGKKQFYRSMMVIAMPIALQNLITVGVSMMDTLMLGSLGEAALSASALANQLFLSLRW